MSAMKDMTQMKKKIVNKKFLAKLKMKDVVGSRKGYAYLVQKDTFSIIQGYASRFHQHVANLIHCLGYANNATMVMSLMKRNNVYKKSLKQQIFTANSLKMENALNALWEHFQI